MNTPHETRSFATCHLRIIGFLAATRWNTWISRPVVRLHPLDLIIHIPKVFLAPPLTARTRGGEPERESKQQIRVIDSRFETIR